MPNFNSFMQISQARPARPARPAMKDRETDVPGKLLSCLLGNYSLGKSCQSLIDLILIVARLDFVMQHHPIFEQLIPYLHCQSSKGLTTSGIYYILKRLFRKVCFTDIDITIATQ